MPLRDRRGYLWDILQAAQTIQTFTEGKSVEDYRSDLMLRSAVERQFEIVGEALAQALKYFPELAGAITSSRQIVNFRNRLIHAYAVVDDDVVWGVVKDDLPLLLVEVERSLKESGDPSDACKNRRDYPYATS